MSRSYQHHAMKRNFKECYFAICKYLSNKKSKQETNRRFRRITKYLMRKHAGEGYLPMKQREISDVWDFASDGLAIHHFINEDSNPYYRK